MKILVTGGKGFLGKHLQKAFGYYPDIEVKFIGSKNCDLRIRNNVERILALEQPNAIVHAAAVCGGIKANANSPAQFMHDNLLMGLNLFELVRYHNKLFNSNKIDRIYTLGSVCAYPKYCQLPFKEDDIWNGYPEETNAPYGISKRVLLMLGQTYRQQYGIGGAHLIPVNLYGEYDHFDLENSHVIPALINKFTDAVAKGLPTVSCWGSGRATREFLYAGDAAKAIVKAVINELDTDLPINLGTGRDISIKELAYLIKELVGFKGEIEFTGDVSDGQPKRRLDVSRAKTMLDFEAVTELKEGIAKTIEWYQKEKYGK